MSETISLPELVAKVTKQDLGKNDLATYFEYDAANSRAFQPRFRINTRNVDVTGAERTARAAGHELALDAERGAREKRLSALAGVPGTAPILAEGDSWFSHPLVKTCVDVLQESGYHVDNLAKPGDTLADILAKREYVPFLRLGRITHFLFSGGGNDVLGDFRYLINLINYDYTDPNNPGHVAYYIKPEFRLVLRAVRANYVQLINDVRAVSPATRLLVNGYAYARPQAHGAFLGDDFEFLGFDLTHEPRHLQLSWAIVRSMVNQFNVMLENLAVNATNVEYNDLRPAVSQNDPADWFDAELHPSRRAARKIALVFARDLPEPLAMPEVA